MTDIPPPPPPSYGDSPTPQTSASGFFRALFDYSFTEFITPKVVKLVYVLATIALVLFWLIFLVVTFSESAAGGVAVLIVGPIVLILYLALVRISLEFYLAVVRMSEDINKRLPPAP